MENFTNHIREGCLVTFHKVKNYKVNITQFITIFNNNIILLITLLVLFCILENGLAVGNKRVKSIFLVQWKIIVTLLDKEVYSEDLKSYFFKFNGVYFAFLCI